MRGPCYEAPHAHPVSFDVLNLASWTRGGCHELGPMTLTLSERFTAWVVDDSPMEAEAVQRVLEASGDVEIFLDGATLLERISLAPLPDVIVLDWMLPGSSGLEICSFLRLRWDEAELPILLLTARGAKADVVEGLSAGANDYVSKPYAPEELAARVSVLVRLRRAHLRALRAESEVRQRETDYRRLTDNLPDVVSRIDHQHRHLYVSPSVTRLWGLPAEHYLGKTTVELGMPANQVAAWNAAVDAALRGREASMHFDLSSRGGLRHFHSRVVPERDEEGNVVSVLCIARDMTSQVRAEQALRESEERLRLALEVGKIGTWDSDPRTLELTCDARATVLFGLKPERKAHPDHLYEPLSPEDRERVRAEVDKALVGENGGLFASEYRTPLAADGIERWVSVQGRVFFDGQGQAVRFLGTVRDISEGRRQEEEARQMAEFQEKLVAIVGHDLRNPLSAIQVSAALLARKLGEPSLLRKLHVISTAADRAGHITRDLLDLTQARLGGGIPVRPQPCELHAVIREVAEEHHAAHPERDIRLDLAGTAEGVWDPERLAQVVANLLSNALNYSPPGTPVEISSQRHEEELVLRFHNQGPPIPEEMRSRLFAPFKRRPERSAGPRDGLGLGLYIAERIVSAHGGHIGVDSTELQGTTFFVHLPWRSPAMLVLDPEG
ncbi:TodK [Stigmatella aurantiaca DW4/3-1]|uniref:histidine kinase n=2 Tax=Stigmatella aurantiaca (strain DW4/3-1) TaxID=378806 RepID=Q09DL9_STIAD|nr:TodK [Stigmatella aurantiaca DW4/3-1]